MQTIYSFWETLSKNVDPKRAFFALFVILVLNKVRSRIATQATYSKIMQKAKKKRSERDAQVALEFTPAFEIPDEISTLILNSTVTQLRQLLNEDKVTSEQILKVYHSRAVTVGLKLELIAESNYKEALQLARKCDEVRKNTPIEERHKLGGLFGIPISIKDSFVQAGLDSTCGGTANCFAPCAKDGEIIAFLKSRGAIPNIRSNVPQTLAILDCTNHIWGRGLNPWNKDRSIGGSSGGEGGLIAAKCSPIGLGSDAMGSVRIPAAFCGIPSFKPTRGRFLTRGHSVVGPYSSSKFSLIAANNGPLGQCVDDLTLFMKEVISEEGRNYDPLSPYVPWDEAKYQSQNKLKIGYVLTEEFFGASKAAQRAVRESVEALKKLGHELVEIKIPNFEKMNLFIIMINTSEGGVKGLARVLAGEKPIKELQGQLALRALPNFVKKGVKSLFKFKGFHRLANIVGYAEELTLADFHEQMHEFFTLRNEFIQYWTNNKFDAIITPAMPVPAYKHGYGVDLAIGSCYLWPANVANLASGVVPVTKVMEGEDVYSPEDSAHIDQMFTHCQETIKGSVGMPLNVQVMTLPWEDEKCLAVMKLIENEAKFQPLTNV